MTSVRLVLEGRESIRKTRTDSASGSLPVRSRDILRRNSASVHTSPGWLRKVRSFACTSVSIQLNVGVLLYVHSLRSPMTTSRAAA